MASQESGRRIVARGIVKSDAMDKSIVVEVKRLIKHPRFRKYVYRSTRYYAHDMNNAAKKGDFVEIVESKPISKLKRWRVAEIVKRVEAIDIRPEEVDQSHRTEEE